MKNLINTSKVLIALMAAVLLAPAHVQAQQTSILSEAKIVDYDKVGSNDLGKIDPPPPPALSNRESTITKVSFYPNPCKDRLTLEFGDNARFQKVSIYNLVGNLIYETTVASNNAILNTSNLKPGIYILKTESASYRFTKI